MWRRHWRFGAAILIQLLILAAVPARKVMALAHGREITLQTRPVDPYDAFSGYYVTLAYEAELVPETPTPEPAEGSTVYVTVERDDPAWRAVGVTTEPLPPQPDRVSLRATWKPGWTGGFWTSTRQARVILTDASRFYVPESQRSEVTRGLSAAGGHGLVDLSVGSDGELAVRRLRIGNRVWSH